MVEKPDWMKRDIDVSDEGDYDGKDGGSINEIILRQIRKIGDISCKEFTGGYWEKKPVKTADGVMFTETYHNDVREEYCNSINFLIDLIYPIGDSTLRTYLDKDESVDKDWGDDVKGKVIQKRKTFKQINLMFERVDFWKGTSTQNE